MPMQIAFDHLAITAPDLDTGAAHVRTALGIDMPPGGRHPLMATHNRLARLGDDEFLEVIATDPDAIPLRPRWFGLDHVGTSPPRLGTWICRTDDLDAALARLPPECGPAVELTRGNLTWRLSVPDDGSTPFDGMFPALIEWPMHPLPATRMTDIGCTLDTLTVRHPHAARIETLIGAALHDPRVRFETGEAIGLDAVIATPAGLRSLR